MDRVLDWLLEGDPAIRWQAMRDLLDAPSPEWQAEQRLTVEKGWGNRLLAQQDPADGSWGAGIYTPKWTSTTYTLLALRGIGIPRDCPGTQRGARLVLDRLLGERCDAAFMQKLADCDRCIVGMILQLAVYFMIEDARVERIVENILEEKMPDGGWNCRRKRTPRPHHSSFHTTFNVLEGLRDFLELCDSPLAAEARAAEKGALELMLRHRLFRSDKTGQVIRDEFTRLAYPYRWHYDFLRGLEYFARAGAECDPRLIEAVVLLGGRRQEDGRWPNEYKYTGKVFFDMEKRGRGSRWNTLRALRVMKWWENQNHGSQT